MLAYENGKLREVDTSGSWLLSILITIIILAPFWLLWKLIKSCFSNKKQVQVKVKKNKNWKSIPNNRKF